MTMEIQTVVIGLLANIVGDQILVMLLTGALHLWGRRSCANIASRIRGEAGMAAPDEAMTPPIEEALLPADAR